MLCTLQKTSQAQLQLKGLVMLHEQDTSQGGCPFNQVQEQTPPVLRNKHQVFKTVAIPLFDTPEHREISRRHAIRMMGATQKRSKATVLRESALVRMKAQSFVYRSSSCRMTMFLNSRRSRSIRSGQGSSSTVAEFLNNRRSSSSLARYFFRSGRVSEQSTVVE